MFCPSTFHSALACCGLRKIAWWLRIVTCSGLSLDRQAEDQLEIPHAHAHLHAVGVGLAIVRGLDKIHLWLLRSWTHGSTRLLPATCKNVHGNLEQRRPGFPCSPQTMKRWKTGCGLHILRPLRTRFVCVKFEARSPGQFSILRTREKTLAYTVYTLYVSKAIAKPATQYVLYNSPEIGAKAPGVASVYAAYKGSEPEDPIQSGMEKLEGADKQDRWEPIIQSIQMLQDERTFEQQDSKHRSSALLLAAHAVYKKKFPNAAKAPDFFRWLDSIPEWERIVMISDAIRDYSVKATHVAPHWLKGTPDEKKKLIADANLKPSVVIAFLKGVAYLDKATRRPYEVKFEGGLLKQADGELLDTSSMKTVFSGPGFAIWVMSPKGRFYVGSHVFGQFHHSSFGSGRKVMGAGEMKAKNGKIEFITAKSGHYQPPIESLAASLEALERMGVDVGPIQVGAWRNGGLTLFSGTNFRARSKGMQSWGNATPAEKLRLARGDWGSFQRG